MPPQIETERLMLRSWCEDDAEDYRALIAERGGDVPDLDAVRARIAGLQSQTAGTGLALLPVERAGRFLGYCGLTIGRATLEEPEVAYELFRSAQGHGYATEVARAVVATATATGRGRLWATVRSWNAPSFRVLEKLGFHRDRTTGDDRGELVWLTRALAPGS
jgi:RimJ/RimL family protein N-acetyltransferase